MTVPNGSIFLSAGFALCFSCFGQDGSVNTPAPLPPALSHLKLIEDFTGAHQAAPVVRIVPRKPVWMTSKASPAAASGQCAHIIMKLAPPDIDKKMVIGVPDGSLGKISVFRGLPQCVQDLR